MQRLAELLPGTTSRSPIGDDGRCPRCGSASVLGHSCCDCLDAGRVRAQLQPGDPEFGRSIPCPSCISQRRITVAPTEAEWFQRSRVGSRFAEATIASWLPRRYTGAGQPQRSVYEWCRDWPPSRPLLLMVGGPGQGKTHLAWGAMREVFNRHQVLGQGWNCADLMARYRATMQEDAIETEAGIDRELDRVPLLLLDDWGTQQDTEWARSRLYGVINRRYEGRRPMIVTTNATLVADRTVSRLVDVASTVVVQFDGRDLRAS